MALLGGCSEEQVQRDVYQSLDDCLADWKKIELCEVDKNTESTQKTETTPRDTGLLFMLPAFPFTSIGFPTERFVCGCTTCPVGVVTARFPG